VGIIDQILGNILNQQTGAPNPGTQSQVSQTQVTDLAQAAMSMLNDPRIGGISGLMQKFQNGGLGSVIESWIGTGQNRAISGQEIGQVLGQQEVDQISQQAGLPPSEGASVLAQLLPLLVDGLTPQGNVPQQNQLAQRGSDLLKKLG
jgi:uncharacterized protein YidB (DUF937 family)